MYMVIKIMYKKTKITSYQPFNTLSALLLLNPDFLNNATATNKAEWSRLSVNRYIPSWRFLSWSVSGLALWRISAWSSSYARPLGGLLRRILCICRRRRVGQSCLQFWDENKSVTPRQAREGEGRGSDLKNSLRQTSLQEKSASLPADCCANNLRRCLLVFSGTSPVALCWRLGFFGGSLVDAYTSGSLVDWAQLFYFLSSCPFGEFFRSLFS
jgi:hypothetical protein